jgi:hypothetical protein
MRDRGEGGTFRVRLVDGTRTVALEGRAVLSCGVGGDSGDEDEVEALLVKK